MEIPLELATTQQIFEELASRHKGGLVLLAKDDSNKEIISLFGGEYCVCIGMLVFASANIKKEFLSQRKREL
jgi:hypothetical protein